MGSACCTAAKLAVHEPQTPCARKHQKRRSRGRQPGEAKAVAMRESCGEAGQADEQSGPGERDERMSSN